MSTNCTLYNIHTHIHLQTTGSARLVNQLLTEMDGLEERKQVFLIAATNRPGHLVFCIRCKIDFKILLTLLS